MNVYFISGVAADERVFQNIHLPAGYKAHHLAWIKPEMDESLKSYAVRLANGIDTTKPFLLVGLSFGGMLANEMAKLYHPVLVVLISSVPSSRQLPPYFTLLGKLRFHKFIPISFFKSMSLLKRLVTTETKAEKQILRQMIRSADNNFIRWSLDAIVKWKNEEKPENYIHIHGSRDLLLPVRYTGYTHLVRGGGHLMVVTHGKEISAIILEESKRINLKR